jgi:hypothetical protein
VARAAEGKDMPAKDVIEASRLPEKIATSYCTMYAHGMYLRIFIAKEEKVTCDSAVASVVFKRQRLPGTFQLGPIETKEYVGWIQEILELNYRLHYCIVLVCS